MKKLIAVVLTVALLSLGLGASAALASPGIWEIAPDSPETPDVSVTDDTITMGTPVGDTTQNMALHGATIEIPPCDEVYVEFDYDLHTWDSFNAVTSTPFSGYWDSFSISVSQDKYWDLTLTDPVDTDPDLDVGFIWGGTNYGDGILESTSGSGSATMAASLLSTNYLNVMLDTSTTPEANHNHASYGEITITKIEILGVPEVTKELIDAWEVPVGEPNGIIDLGEKWFFVMEITVTNNTSLPITNVMVKDNLGGDLELNEWSKSTGTFDHWTTGKTEKVHMMWDVGTLAPGQTETLWLLVSTDINTGTGNGKKPGHQEYTSEGEHCLNSGATAKGLVTLASGVWEVADTTDEICVETGQPPPITNIG